MKKITHNQMTIVENDFDKYTIIKNEDLKMVYEYTDILQKQINHFQKMLQASGICYTFYNGQGERLTLKDLSVEVDMERPESSHIVHLKGKSEQDE